MAVVAFQGLRPALGVEHAEWVVASLIEPPGVAFRVPDSFERIVRIHHPLADGHRWADTPWSDLLTAGETKLPHPGTSDVPAELGCLDPAIVDRLVPALTEVTSTPASCHYAIWSGWGWLHAGSVHVLVASLGHARDRGRESLGGANEIMRNVSWTR